MAALPVAFPYIEVTINTSGLQPVATRSPGVIAVVGKTTKGSAPANTPFVIDGIKDAESLFAKDAGDPGPTATPLFQSLGLAFQQDPRPAKVYGVRVNGDDYAAALASLEAVDDVTFVSLANETSVGQVAQGANAPTALQALKAHVENASSDGHKRIGVAMVDPGIAKSDTYVATVKTDVDPLKSDDSRMVMIAARGVDGDAATAAMAAMAGFPPQTSLVLKRIRGIHIPLESQYSPTEIKGLAGDAMIPIVSPTLIVGGGLFFGDGFAFTNDGTRLFVDIVRVLDDIEFRLKAGLIGSIGDARITRSGMTGLKTTTEGILGPLKRNNVIVDFSVDIPVLSILSVPEATLNATDKAILTAARLNRAVPMSVTVVYSGVTHHLGIDLVFTV